MDILLGLFLLLGILAFLVVIVGAIPKGIRDAAWIAVFVGFAAGREWGSDVGLWAGIAAAAVVIGISTWADIRRDAVTP